MYQIAWVGRSLLVGLIAVSGFCFPAIAETSSQVMPSVETLSLEISKEMLDQDIPEEVLRSEIYAEARSSVDGKLLSADEYIELNQSLRESIDNIPPRFLVSQKVQRLIELLKLRRLIRLVVPFF